MTNRFNLAVAGLFWAMLIPFANGQTTFYQIVGPEFVCQGDCATYIVQSPNNPGGGTGIIVNWSISGPGGFISQSQQNPTTICFPEQGTYFLKAEGISLNGVVIVVDSFIVIVTPFLPVQITSDNPALCDSTDNASNDNCEKVCPNTTVTYSIQGSSPGGPTTSLVSWSVNGAQSFLIDSLRGVVTVTWGEPGIGSVSAVVFAGQCAGEDGQCVTIIEEPEADFTTTPSAAVGDTLRICQGQTVWFNNQSAYADNYEWFFGDGSAPVTTVNSQHDYLNPGFYTVTLIARSSCLCADTTTRVIEVLSGESPVLDCVGTVCAGATVTYTTSASCTGFTWSVSNNGTILSGGGLTDNSITIQWNQGPSGQVTLLAQSCTGAACPQATETLIPVIDNTAEIRGAERVCPSAEEVYTIEPYQGTGFVWTLSGGGTILEGQGTNRVVVKWASFPSPTTTRWLSVQYDNCYLGCGGQDSIGVLVLSPFVINGPVELCENAAGTFNARLITPSQALNSNWTVFGPNGGVAFTDTGNSINPNFINGPGIYRIWATAVDPNQTCTDQADWAVNIPALPAGPTGIQGNTIICPGDPFTYRALGLPPNANVRWTIQDGAGAPVTALGNPLVVQWGATAPRTLSVEQLSNDGLNCASVPVQITVTPFDPLLAVINGPDSVCANGNTVLECTAAQGLDLNWSIPSGAGTIVTGQGGAQVEIFWNVPGTHTVQLSACGQMVSRNITVLPLPNPIVSSPAGVCQGATTLVGTTNSFDSYSWQTSTGIQLGNTATLNLGPGNYTVIVADAFGCSGSAAFSLNTFPVPNVSISTADPTGFCNNSQTVILQALAGVGAPLTYEWFRDGTSLGASGPVYSTNQYGNYIVVATNAQGCTATAGPILLFQDCSGGGGGGGLPGGGGPGCPPGSVDIQTITLPLCDTFGFAVLPGANYATGSAQWFFGLSGGPLLGNTTGDLTGFSFPNAGTYIVLMRASLTNGAVCVVWDTVVVEAAAQFDTLPACAGLGTLFTNISTYLPNSNITGQSWDFGDPASGANNTSATANPQHVYAGGGVYNVTLTVTAQSGCTAISAMPVSIPDGTPLPFALPSVTCVNTSLLFTAIPGPDILNIGWNFGDPGSGAANTAAGDSVYHSFGAGSYTITATTTNTRGCTASTNQVLNTSPNLLSGDITPNAPAPLCEGASIVLTAPAGAVSYLWSDSMTIVPTLTTDESGLYAVTLTDANGCTYAPPVVEVNVVAGPDALIKALIKNELGQIIGVSYPQLNACFGDEVHLIAQGAGNYSYTWTTGSSEDEQIFSETRFNLLGVGPHVFHVTVTDNITGCTSVSEPFIVTIHPKPALFTISQDQFPACAGAITTLSYNGAPPANTQLVWNTGAVGASLTTTEPGQYYLRAVNQFGCVRESDPLTILPGPNVRALPSGCHTRCRPDTICLPNLPGITAWQWYQDGAPVPGAITADFTAQQSGTYWAVLTDASGCTAQSDPLRLDLYDGFGNILGEVWSDVNNNGSIDAGDTLVNGINVNLWQNNTTIGNAQSGVGGNFAFANILSTNYVVALDTASVPAQWDIVIGAESVSLSGCDAAAQARLLLRLACQATSSILPLSACNGDSVQYNGVWLFPGTVQEFMLTTALGCDSLVTVYVAPLPHSAGTLNVSACQGSNYDYNGTLIPAGQSQSFLLSNYLGCDSTLTVSVAVLPTSSGTLNVSACAGSAYDYDGMLIPAGQSQAILLSNYLGCDSTLTINVATLPTSSSTLNASACAGGNYDYNGTLIPAGQSQDFLLSNYLGCDSTLTVNVATLPTSSGTLNASACAGGNYDYNGTLIPAGQSQSFLLSNYLGCDSTLTVNVATLPTSSGTLNASACAGGSYDYNGTLIPAGQSQSFLLSNYLGCDSTLTVNVSTLPTSTGILNASACVGSNYDYNGTLIPAGQSQTFLLSNYLGCDSTLTVNVAVLPVYDETETVTVCPGATYDFNGASLSPGETRTFRLVSQEGCDSTVTISVLAFPDLDFSLQTNASCNNQAGGTLGATALTGGTPPFEYSLDGQVFQSGAGFSNLPPDRYTLYIRDSNGCLFEKDTVVDGIPALIVELSNGILPCESPAVLLQPFIGGDTTGLDILWSNGANTPAINVMESGQVWVEVTNQCETIRREARVEWADFSDKSLVYVPNVFAPRSSYPENYHFRPYFAGGLQILRYDFIVADRWGNLLFQSADPESAWPGPFRAEDMQPGVFVWYLEADIQWCGRTQTIRLKGDVTVVR